MTGQRRFLNRMGIFVLAVAILVAMLIEPLSGAFAANPLLNGTIAAVLLIGIVYAFRQVLMLRPEIAWLKACRRSDPLPEDMPVLLGPVAAMLGGSAGGRITAMSMRSLLDGVASRLEEGREISRYLTRLLVFLGLLGTFWGLLAVLASIGNTIQGLSVETTDLNLMFDSLKTGLGAPLDGMAVAFSSSLFGLAGSIVLGFLDLQAGQAQNRFFNDLEDWLSSVARVTRSGPGGTDTGDEDAGVSAGAYLSALLEQTADSIDQLRRAMEQAEDKRAQGNEALIDLSEKLAVLTDHLRADQTSGRDRARAEEQTRKLLERIAERLEAAEGGLDEASRGHLRNLDLHMKRLLEDQAKATGAATEALRSEIKLLARTLAGALETRGRGKEDAG